MDGDALLQSLTAFDASVRQRDKTNRPAVEVAGDRLLALLTHLRRAPELAFDMLLDHTAVDLPEPGRIECFYTLYSTVHGHLLMVCTSVPRDRAVVPTVSALWPTAHWQEREVFDLMGVQYDDHSDLRRLFLEDDWQGHPLRKDYQDADMLELAK